MKKLSFILTSLILISFLFSPFISLLLPDSLRDHAYRKIIMHVIAIEETRGLKSKTEIAKRLFYYTAKNTLLNPNGILPYEETILGYLENGLVFCDYEADILAMLCAHKGIHARYCMLKDKDGISPHTLTEILLDGKWRVFDPAEVCYYTTKSGELATIEDLSKAPNLILQNKRWQKIKEISPEEYNNKASYYKRMFPVPYEPQRSSSKIKRITPFDRVGFIYYSLFGKKFLRIYQDLYLNLKTRNMDREEKLYRLARDYHLVHRSEEAILGYNNFVKLYPEGLYSNRVVLFLAFVYMDQKNDYPKAIENLLILVNRPENIYEKYALYYIGKCDELLGRHKEAEEYFDKSGLYVRLAPSLAN